MDIRDSAVTRELLLSCSEEQITFMNECSLQKMKGMQAYIAIRAGAIQQNFLIFHPTS